MKKIKKVAIITSVIMAMCSSITTMNTYGIENESISKDEVENIGGNTFVSRDIKSRVSNIPIYFVYIDDYNNENNPLKQNVIDVIDNYNAMENKNDISKNIKSESIINNENVKIDSNQCDIVKLSETDKSDILNNIAFANTIKRANEVIQSGKMVENIKIFLPRSSNILKRENNLEAYSMNASTRANYEDPNYWYNISVDHGTSYSDGRNYRFRYMESQMTISARTENVGNVNTSANWGEITKWGIKAGVNMYTPAKGVMKVFETITNALDQFVQFNNVKIDITCSPSKTICSGSANSQLFVRTILIEDVLNLINGYAYYPYGSAEQLTTDVVYSVYYPSQSRPGGTYDYKTAVSPVTRHEFHTPGFLCGGGSRDIYVKMIMYYKKLSTLNYDETIDVDTEVINFFR